MINTIDIIAVIAVILIKYTLATEDIVLPHHPISLTTSSPIHQVTTPWSGTTTRDLHREYSNIFKYGNRNAASHRWSTFLLERSEQFTLEKLTYMFTGFCAVSGSPITPSDFNRYGLTLDNVAGTSSKIFGFMHYCCWPCVCDTQDFIKIDTKNITLSNGQIHQQYFAVIGNPCDNPSALKLPFVQPFDGRSTSIEREAQEVRCNADGTLEGATISDHGYVIINMFFDAEPIYDQEKTAVTVTATQEPGRMSSKSFHNNDPTSSRNNINFQSEREFQGHCTDRANKGYNSGMGEIFRKVANISPVPLYSNSNEINTNKKNEL